MTHNNLFSALRAAFPADLTATAVETDSTASSLPTRLVIKTVKLRLKN